MLRLAKYNIWCYDILIKISYANVIIILDLKNGIDIGFYCGQLRV